MRKTALFLALMILPILAWGQSYVVTPYVSTKAIASIATTVGSTTISSAAKAFGSVVVGQPVYGVGVPAGTTVLSLVNADLDSQVVLSKAITQGGTKTLEFGYYTHTTYGTGDWLGLPFVVYENAGVGGEEAIVSLVIDDKSDLLDDVDVVFFSNWSDTLGLDSAAVNIPAAEALKVVGVVSLTSGTDLGGGRTLEEKAITLAVPRTGLYGRLIARATMGPFLVVNPFKIRIGLR
jgi:hypothetical protein